MRAATRATFLHLGFGLLGFLLLSLFLVGLHLVSLRFLRLSSSVFVLNADNCACQRIDGNFFDPRLPGDLDVE